MIGGFHLLDAPPEQMTGTLAYFTGLKVEAVHACHCTDLNAKIELAKVAPLKAVGSGLVLEY